MHIPGNATAAFLPQFTESSKNNLGILIRDICVHVCTWLPNACLLYTVLNILSPVLKSNMLNCCCSFKKVLLDMSWMPCYLRTFPMDIFCFLYIEISNSAVWRCFMRYAETETWTGLISRLYLLLSPLLSNTRKHKFISLW